MICPECKTEMEAGELELRAFSMSLAPQAQLRFNDELILKDQYLPVIGLFRKGTHTAGHRCKNCRLVVLHYPDQRGA